MRLTSFAWLVFAACVGTKAIPPTRPPMTSGASTLAGWSEAGYVDGQRDVNLFANPTNVALGPDGMLYVADFDNDKLRAVDADGNASTVIAQPGFSRPFGLAFAGTTLYVQTDNDATGAHSSQTGTIWIVDLAAATATPIAQGIGRPRGLAPLRDGRIALSDYVHHVVQILDPATATVTPLAGAWDTPGFVDAVGANARFSEPYAIVQRADGTLVVADHANDALRTITLDGAVTTLAGGTSGFADGPLAQARFAHPQGLALAASGELYVSDADNFRIRRVSGDAVDTIAGNGTAGYADADDPLAAELYGLEGLSVASDGSAVFVADGTRGEDVPFNRVRTIVRRW